MKKLVDVLNGAQTDIVREVRRADTILHNILSALDEDVNPLTAENMKSLLREARKHLAAVTD